MDRNICKFTSPSCPEGLKVSCFVLETNPQTAEEPYQLPCNRMILICEGGGYFDIDGDRLPFGRGNLIFCLKGERISAHPQGTFKYMYIDFDGLRAGELMGRFYIHQANRLRDGFDGLAPLWEESLARASEENIDLVAESMLLYSFSRLNGRSAQREGILSEILKITESDFNDFDLSIASIAERLGYNAKYLSHLFKKKTNKSYSEYLRTLRVKYAVSLLDNGIDSIKNVALLSGFSDPLYFSNVFKKVMGVSPKEYAAGIKNPH